MRIDERRRSGRGSARRAASILLALLTVGAIITGCATTVSGSAVRAAAGGSTAGGSAAGGGACAPETGPGCAPPGADTSTPPRTSTAGSAPESTRPESAGPSTTDPKGTSPSSTAPNSTGPSSTGTDTGSGTDTGPRTGGAPTPASADHDTGRSVATVDGDGTITLAAPHPGRDTVTIDVYEDALCPFCGAFEQQYGTQIRRAVDKAALTVRYRLVTFLDAKSASGTYSTRAFAAMLAVAADSGDRPGLFATFHTMLFDPAVQPREGGPDLTDAQLADVARQAGAPDATVSDVADGRFGRQAATAAAANLALLSKDSPEPGTPTVIHDHTVVRVSDPAWLQSLLGG